MTLIDRYKQFLIPETGVDWLVGADMIDEVQSWNDWRVREAIAHSLYESSYWDDRDFFEWPGR